MWWFWTLISLISFLIEILTPGSLVSIWFCLAGILTAVVSLVIQNFSLQILIFFLSSLFALFSIRPLISMFFEPKYTPTNADRNIGKKGIVTKTIRPHEIGSVKVEGQVWSAVSNSLTPILENEIVIVEKISGVKLIVRKDTYEYIDNNVNTELVDHLINSHNSSHTGYRS